MAARRRLIVVSNRGPVTYERSADGDRVARRGAGGLVTALAPLVSRHDVTWVASAMSDEERRIADAGAVEETAADGSRYRLHLVRVAAEAFRLFYDVVANPVLWFVQHGLWERLLDPAADLRAPWRDGYVAVNEAFAAAVVDELDRDPGAAAKDQLGIVLWPAVAVVKAHRRADDRQQEGGPPDHPEQAVHTRVEGRHFVGKPEPARELVKSSGQGKLH
mgnify:CR=1 FL=1